MVRITKAPEERKKEIIETAAKIFNEKGYENTAVSDIVKSINVAQGTFYYYFKSKEELIEPIVEFIMNKSLGEVEEIIKSDKTAVEKFREIVANRIRFAVNRGKVVEFMWNKNNNFIFEKFKRYAISKAAPIFKLLVEQGKKEGVINVEYPEETIRIIILTALDFAEQIWISKDGVPNSKEEIYQKLKAYENIIKRLLEIKNDIEISFVDTIIGELIKNKIDIMK